MPTIRYAIWAAVSTKEQAAEDKHSLETQVERSRAHAASRGWLETAGPYIVPGESRTRWVNLSDAERAIPQLKQLLDDARAGTFDLVICYEFDRFRELLDPVARTLSFYGVQLYSVSQPLEPQDPATYSPYSNDAEQMLRGMNQILSRAAIANLRRKYETQMPKRATEKGIAPNSTIPWGYRRPPGHERDRDAVPEPIPEITAILIQLKNMHLAGQSSRQLAEWLTQQNIPTPTGKTTWDQTAILRIISNPYYAGIITWGSHQTKRDPLNGHVWRTMRTPPIRVQGKHTPIWDETTHNAILAEYNRRNTRKYIGRRSYALSGIMICGICGAPLWRTTRNGTRPIEERTISWFCSVGHAKHIIVTNELMLQNIAALLETIITAPPEPAPVQDTTTELTELQTRRARIGDAYEIGQFDLAEFTRRTSALDQRITELQTLAAGQAAQRTKAEAHAQGITTLQRILETTTLLEFITTSDPQTINTLIKTIIKTATIAPTGEITSIIRS